MSTPPPPLMGAQATIQHIALPLRALPHIIHSLSDFLDMTTRIPLHQAVSRGSPELVDRVAQRLLSDQQLSPAMRNHSFTRAMQAAIERNDLFMVQQLHALHPQPLVVYSLQLAMKHGTLEMVQWVMEHRHDRLCCAPGIANVCKRCLFPALATLGTHDALRVIQWLHSEGVALSLLNDGTTRSPLVHAALFDQEVLHWCDSQGLVNQEAAESLLTDVISSNNPEGVSTFEYLIARGFTVETSALMRSLIVGSCNTENKAVIDAAVASHISDPLREHFEYSAVTEGGAKVIQWRRDFVECPGNENIPAMILHSAMKTGHIDTLRWLSQQGYALPHHTALPCLTSEQELIRFCQEIADLGLLRWHTSSGDMEAGRGHLEFLEWLLTQTTATCTAAAMDLAAGLGHLHVVQWLHANRTEGCSDRAMEMAASNGHLEVVKWLCENRSEHNISQAMACAASQGQLEVLLWLHETQVDACVSCATHVLLRGVSGRGRSLGALNGLQWLREHSSQMACAGRCYGTLRRPFWLGQLAVFEGDLQLLQYLLEHYPENGSPESPGPISIAGALASGGHVSLAQWAYTHIRDSVDWNRVRELAMAPHNPPEVLAWLDSQS